MLFPFFLLGAVNCLVDGATLIQALCVERWVRIFGVWPALRRCILKDWPVLDLRQEVGKLL